MTKSGAPTGRQVTAVLQSLAVQRASGVLEIDGNPAGAIYFDRGHITFARASQVPDLVARLTYLLRPSGELGHLLHGGDQPDRDMGALLLQHRAIGADQLRAIMRSAVVDAVLVFSVPVAGESCVSDIRFQVPGAHWAGSYFRLPVDMVRSEAAGWAELMARQGLACTAALQLRALKIASGVLTPRQWAVACEIDGTRSAQDLAWRCGLALYETVECVGELVRAGICAPIPASRPRIARPPSVPASRPPAAWSRPPGSVPVALPPPREPSPREPSPRQPSPLPQREPGSMVGGQTGPGTSDADSIRPAPELLRRVLEGLRKLG